MAKSEDDIKYGTAQARLSEDEAVRVRYKHGTPLEGGKIADSGPVDLFSGAHNVSSKTKNNQPPSDNDSTHQAADAGHQSQLQRDPDAASGGNATTIAK